MRPLAVFACLALFGVVAGAQLPPERPSFSVRNIVPANSDLPERLSPGMLVSILGEHLSGSGLYCTAPVPYPIKLCETRVTVAGIDAPLVYVGVQKINFRVPANVPDHGSGEVRVTHENGATASAVAQFGRQPAVLSLDEPAYTGMPVWLHVDVAFARRWAVRYPFDTVPWSLDGHEVEVRFRGAPLSPIALTPLYNSMPPASGWLLGLPGEPRKKQRLPLHLLYRFENPGTYEVRYTAYRENPPQRTKETVDQSEWTSIQVLPSTEAQRREWLGKQLNAMPADPVELLADFLPGILASSDPSVVNVLEEQVYSANGLVRQYALNGLAYFAGNRSAEDIVRDLILRKGPVDTLAYFLSWHRDKLQPSGAALVDAVVPVLTSRSPLRAAGALRALIFLKAHYDWSQQPAMPGRIDAAVLAASPQLLALGEPVAHTLAEYLGTVKTKQSRDMLWDLVGTNVAREQALICLTWIADPADLPRLADLIRTGADDDMGRSLASTPYGLRRAYGDQAIPYLERILTETQQTWVRVASAKELALAGRSSGFAFLLEAIEQNRAYRQELVRWVRDSFRETGPMSEAEMTAFLKSKVAARN